VDSAAFIESTVVTAMMLAKSARFALPSMLFIRISRAALSGVSGAGTLPVSVGVAPSGAWRETMSPPIALAKPVRLAAPHP